MMAHDDEFLDSIALLALGVLPQSEAAPLAEHVRGCVECRAAYADLRAAADLVGFAAEAAPGEFNELRAARLKSRVMSAVRSDLAASALPAIAPPSIAPPVAAPPAAIRAEPRGRSGERSARPWFAYLAIAATLTLAVLTGVDDLALRSVKARAAAQIAILRERAETEASVAAAASSRARDLGERLALLTAPGSKYFSVPGGEVVTGRGRVIIALQHAPALPPGKVFQAWTLRRGAKTVAPSVTFAPDPNGVTVIELPEAAADLAAVAVTIEPAGGSKVPTTTPAFVRKLS
jgi:hypothetical protein